MLRAQGRIAGQDVLRVESTASPAREVARALDPSAATLEEQIRAVERATPREIDAAVRTADEPNPGFRNGLSDDFNPRATSAGAAEATVSHWTDDIADRDERVRRIVSTVGGTSASSGASLTPSETRWRW